MSIKVVKVNIFPTFLLKLNINMERKWALDGVPRGAGSNPYVGIF